MQSAGPLERGPGFSAAAAAVASGAIKLKRKRDAEDDEEVDAMPKSRTKRGKKK